MPVERRQTRMENSLVNEKSDDREKRLYSHHDNGTVGITGDNLAYSAWKGRNSSGKHALDNNLGGDGRKHHDSDCR